MASKKEFREILDRSRTYLSLAPRSPESLLFGDWDSAYVGEGFEFEKFREYREGDNTKRIHAAMSSRMGKPMVIRHLEPREARMLIVLDMSPSMKIRDKEKIAFTALSMIFSSGFDIHMPVSIWGVGSEKELRMTPPIDHGSLDYVVDAMIQENGRNPFVEHSVPSLSLDDWMFFLPGGSLIFVISDFLGKQDSNLKQLLGSSLHGYKVVPVVVQDDLEYTFPDIPFAADVPLVDAETGQTSLVRIDKETAREFRNKHEERFSDLKAFFEGSYFSFAHTPTQDIDNIYDQLEKALLR